METELRPSETVKHQGLVFSTQEPGKSSNRMKRFYVLDAPGAVSTTQRTEMIAISITAIYASSTNHITRGGGVKDPEGKHRLWLHVCWRLDGNDVDYFEKVTTMRLKDPSELVVIKF